MVADAECRCYGVCISVELKLEFGECDVSGSVGDGVDGGIREFIHDGVVC